MHLDGRGTTTIRDIAGPADAPTLLLLHGWTATADLNWGACYARLAERFRVVALDHRGHGDGIRSDELFTLEDCADDAAHLLRALEIDQAIVVGYSMGGPIAQLMWQRHREQVAGLVLCATADHFVETRLEHLLGPVTGLATSMSRHLPAAFWTRLAVESARHRSRGDADLREQALRVAASHCWKAIFEAGRAIAAFDSRSWVGSVDVPTAVVATMQDHLVSHWTSARHGRPHRPVHVAPRSWTPRGLRSPAQGVRSRTPGGLPRRGHSCGDPRGPLRRRAPALAEPRSRPVRAAGTTTSPSRPKRSQRDMDDLQTRFSLVVADLHTWADRVERRELRSAHGSPLLDALVLTTFALTCAASAWWIWRSLPAPWAR